MNTPREFQVGGRFKRTLQTATGGRYTAGLRTYDVSLAHDPLAIVQTPARMLSSPFDPSRTVLRAGVWGRRNWRPHRPPHSMLELGLITGIGPRETVVDMRPADTTQVVAWHNPIRFTEQFRAPINRSVYEVVRTNAMRPGVGVLEKIATWIRVQAIDQDGNNVGPPFETFQDTTPRPFPITHPLGLGALFVAWVLIADPAADLPGMLFAAPPEQIPFGEPVPGFDRRWADNRYSWGSRYTETHYSVIPHECAVRLFVELAGSPFFLVEAGGQVAAHSRIQGPAAFRAAEVR